MRDSFTKRYVYMGADPDAASKVCSKFITNREYQATEGIGSLKQKAMKPISSEKADSPETFI